MKEIKRQYLPALRGIFGDWVYYSCLMPMREVVKRIEFASEIRDSKKLSDMIQREIKKGRSKEIATYLKREEQRFFNSLVVAVYDGKPSWHGFQNFQPTQKDIDMSEVSSDAENSVGFLSFTGHEKMFAIDGQHRLAGMKSALSSAEDDLDDEEVSIIFVAHKDDLEGRVRTRKLFVTLNKTAKPVGKGEIIALDECDVMAIATRYLIESHELFDEDRIRFVQTNNLPFNNITEFTTIGNIYDVLTVVFTQIKDQKKPYELRFFRPSDEELEEYFRFTNNFFESLAQKFAPLGEYFKAEDDSEVIQKYRHSNGGHILFRPIGLLIMTEVIGFLTKQKVGFLEAMTEVSKLPADLSQEPYADVIWLTKTHRMNPKKRVLCRRLLLHMLGYEKKPDELRKQYSTQLEIELDECQLPNQLV